MQQNLYCTVCHVKPCWFDTAKNQYSPYCSNSCRIKMLTNQHKFVPIYNPNPAIQGQPICQICSNAAYFDGTKYSPGCCKSHCMKAQKLGLYAPIH